MTEVASHIGYIQHLSNISVQVSGFWEILHCACFHQNFDQIAVFTGKWPEGQSHHHAEEIQD